MFNDPRKKTVNCYWNKSTLTFSPIVTADITFVIKTELNLSHTNIGGIFHVVNFIQIFYKNWYFLHRKKIFGWVNKWLCVSVPFML
jgi:hypothetical protein